MNKIKLIQLLRTLNKDEFDRFGLFVNSPLINERETLCRLFEEIEKFYPEFQSKDFTKEHIFSKIHNERAYNDELMRNMFSRLYKLLEKYLSFINFEKDSFDQKYRLLEELSLRGHEKLYHKKFENIKQSSVETNVIDLSVYHQQFQLSCISLEHFFAFPYQPDVDMDILIEKESKMIEYFIAEAMNIYSMMTHDMTLHPEKKYDLGFFEKITGYIETKPKLLEGNYYLRLNFSVIQLLLTKDDRYYSISKDLLNRYSARLSREEKSKLYTALLNFLQAKIFSGESDKLREKFNLYKEAFTNEGMYQNNKVKHAEVILAINNSLMLNEVEEAEIFLAKYADEFDEYYRESTKFYCQGLIDYYKRDYKSALRNLSKVNYSDISYKALVRTLTLMVYYSMNDAEGFFTLVDSYRHFLDVNKKALQYSYEVTANLINLTVRLFRGRESPEKFDLAEFKQEVIGTNHVARKQWLIQMIEELENERK